jgi:hypothetical protein
MFWQDQNACFGCPQKVSIHFVHRYMARPPIDVKDKRKVRFTFRMTEREENDFFLSSELSLQDVFSDSANLEGMHQKTLPLFETEQGKEAQLEEKWNLKSKKNGRGGRKKLQVNQKKTIKLQIHVNAQEYEILTEQHQISGLRYLSDYLRILILDEKNQG